MRDLTKEELSLLAEEGKSVKEMSYILGIPAAKVRDFLKLFNVPIQKPRIVWDEARVIELKNHIAAGLTYVEIAEIYHVSKQRIEQVVREKLKETGRIPNERVTKRNRFTGPEWRIRKLLQCGTDHLDRSKLCVEDFLPLPTHCPILSIELNYASFGRSDFSPSIDRIDNSKGYTKDNVTIMSWRANRIKNNGTAEEHKLIYEYLMSKGL